MSDVTPPPAAISKRDAHPSPRWMIALTLVFLVVAAYLIHLVKPLSINGRVASGGSSGQVTLVTTPGTTTIPRSQVIVQVANGTPKNGLARRFSDQLQIQGWNTLAPINGPRVSATVVYYTGSYQPAAQAIAATIGVRNVQPLSDGGIVPGAAMDAVVVIIGPDLAN